MDFGDGLYSPLSPVGKARPKVQDADLRIAIYSSNFFNEDGVTLTCRRIISKVKKLGGKVVVLTTIPKNRKHGALGDRTMLDSEIIEIPAMDLPLPSYDRKEHECEEREHDGYVVGQKLGQRAMRELLEFDPQIMHITCPDGGGLAAISWAYRHNVPVMSTWHSNFQDYLGFYPLPQVTIPVVTTWLWFFYMQIPIVLVPTAPLRLELASRLGLNPRRMAVWGRGINSRTFSPELRSEAFRAKYGVRPSSLLLCWSSRIVLEKRFDIFVEVVRRYAP
jgi:glycosyltransferase involved in cell wall biosynthesis